MDIAAERAYPTPFANSSLLPLLLLSLMRQKNSPTTSKVIQKEYDYVVVGAGSAGSVVASRLSELPCARVLLLEAGKAPPYLSDIPGISRSFWFTDIDWAYKTVPQKYTGANLVNRQVVWPSGKVLGGSSLLNAMLNVRGNMKNYDDWEAQGAQGWGYKDVLRYFLKLEDNQDPEYVANGFHGTSGPLTIERPRYDPEIKNPIFEAAEGLGYKVVDPNGRTQTGFYDLQGNTRDGQRCSTAKAYLVPAENRTNLDILPHAFVRKVTIEKRRATGVVFDYEGQTYEVNARKEVIMSAGAINSAQLLMLSGIGPRKHLEDMNINVVADLPVGENLQDHIEAGVNYELDSSIPTIASKFSDPRNAMEYINNRTGPLSSLQGTSALAFLRGLNSAPIVDFPNYQLYFAEGATVGLQRQFGLKTEAFEQLYGPYENKPFYICLSSLLQPKSRGTVKLQSANPHDPPLIDPNYFSNPSDIQDMVQGLKVCNRIATSKPMQKVGSRPFQAPYPGCERYAGNEDRYYECQARSAVISLSHQTGTAKMGDPRDPSTVVDPKLRVKGIQGLRVVDASIMPIVPSGNTNVPTIMVAEKASDIIKETIKCQPYSPPLYNQNNSEEEGVFDHFKKWLPWY